MATKTIFRLQRSLILRQTEAPLPGVPITNSVGTQWKLRGWTRSFTTQARILITSLHFLEEMRTGWYLLVFLTANCPESMCTISLLIAWLIT